LSHVVAYGLAGSCIGEGVDWFGKTSPEHGNTGVIIAVRAKSFEKDRYRKYGVEETKMNSAIDELARDNRVILVHAADTT
jgi:hypothetical protein